MKVEVEWTYAYMTEHRFKEVVEIEPLPDEDEEETVARAEQAAQMVPNGDLKPIATTYPGEPCDDMETARRVPDDTKARIRAGADEDSDPELIEVEPTPEAL